MGSIQTLPEQKNSKPEKSPKTQPVDDTGIGP